MKKQIVRIGEADFIEFAENEPILMEISQKYSVSETDEMAKQAGFKPVEHFFDKKNWFLDAVWECN